MLMIKDDSSSYLRCFTVEDPISEYHGSYGAGVSIYHILDSGIRIRV